MTVARSVALFLVAAVFETGGAWLVWQGVRENKGWVWAGAGVIALGLYGFVTTLQHHATSAACWPPAAASSSPDRSPGA